MVAATTYPARDSLAALQGSITRLESVYFDLDSFVNGSAEPPVWAQLLGSFRGALDQSKTAASELDLLTSNTS